MKVLFERKGSIIELTWHFKSAFDEFEEFTFLLLEADIDFSIKGVNERFHVQFTNPFLIQSVKGNYLGTEMISAAAKRKLYISDTERFAIETVGTAIRLASFSGFAIAIGLSLFQTVALGPFWIFIDTVQMLSYLPLINCFIPANLEMVLSSFLDIGDLAIPFDIFPDWFPDPKEFFEVFKTLPLNERFEMCGFESLHFLYNFADELTTWLTLTFIYILLSILTKIIPSSRYTSY